MSIPDHSYDATLRHRPAPDGSIDAIAKRRSPELGDAGEPGGVQTRCVDLDGSWRVTEAINGGLLMALATKALADRSSRQADTEIRSR